MTSQSIFWYLLSFCLLLITFALIRLTFKIFKFITEQLISLIIFVKNEVSLIIKFINEKGSINNSGVDTNNSVSSADNKNNR